MTRSGVVLDYIQKEPMSAKLVESDVESLDENLSAQPISWPGDHNTFQFNRTLYPGQPAQDNVRRNFAGGILVNVITHIRVHKRSQVSIFAPLAHIPPRFIQPLHCGNAGYISRSCKAKQHSFKAVQRFPGSSTHRVSSGAPAIRPRAPHLAQSRADWRRRAAARSHPHRSSR